MTTGVGCGRLVERDRNRQRPFRLAAPSNAAPNAAPKTIPRPTLPRAAPNTTPSATPIARFMCGSVCLDARSEALSQFHRSIHKPNGCGSGWSDAAFLRANAASDSAPNAALKTKPNATPRPAPKANPAAPKSCERSASGLAGAFGLIERVAMAHHRTRGAAPGFTGSTTRAVKVSICL